MKKQLVVQRLWFSVSERIQRQENRERFILPKTEEIKLFTDTINKSVEFFKNKIYKKYFIFQILKVQKLFPESGKVLFKNLDSSIYNRTPQHKFCSDVLKPKNQGISA